MVKGIVMGNPQLGFTVLGSIVLMLSILALVVHFGKKYYDEREADKDKQSSRLNG